MTAMSIEKPTAKNPLMGKLKSFAPILSFGFWALIFLVVLPNVLSEFQVNLLGRFITYAMVAIALDLIWGYTGMLSLGQGLYFGIGAYCFAMYLTLEKTAGKLPEFMGLYGVESLPLIWQPFQSPIFALVMAIGLPMLIAAGVGYVVFRSRIQGVYFSLITQALTFIVSLLLIGQQQLINGTNGLTSFSTIFGFSLKNSETKLGLYIASVIALGFVYLLSRWIIKSRFGRLLVAIRDDETRVRFAGYNPVKIKVITYAIAAGLSGLAGVLFVPQVGIISPAALGIVPSIEIVIWVAVGGRGSLVGAILGAIIVNAGKSSISTAYPETWQFIMGALFIGVVLLFPNGIVGLPKQIMAFSKRFMPKRKNVIAPVTEHDPLIAPYSVAEAD